MSQSNPLLKCQRPTPKKKLRPSTTAVAVATLIRSLKRDTGYRKSWEANIAMCFYDEALDTHRKKRTATKNGLMKIANGGAKRFVDLLINKSMGLR